MPAAKTPEDYHALAAARGLEWLGTTPPGTLRPTTWRCRAEGHVFARTYNRIQAIQRCPHCVGRVRKAPADYHRLAQAHHLTWLGPDVATTRAATQWQCAQGHRFAARYSTIQQGSGCPHCSGKAPKTAADYAALAQAQGLVWLGKRALPTRALTRWRCVAGHAFRSTYNRVRAGHGCPTCAGNAPHSDQDYRRAGRSHGLTWLGPRGANARVATRWRCAAGHVWETTLETVRRGLGCPMCRPARVAPEQYQALAQARGLTWLGPEFATIEDKTRWRCGQGHVFETRYAVLRRGSGCPRCAGRAARTAGDYAALARTRGFTWQGPAVPTTRQKTGWRCGQGHAFQASFNAVSRGSGCPECAGNRRKTEADYRRIGRAQGLTWLGPLGANAAAKTRWRCRRGHLWETQVAAVAKGRRCPKCTGRARKTAADYKALARARKLRWVGSELPRTTAVKTEWACSLGHRWRQRYNSIQQGSGCPLCARAPDQRRRATRRQGADRISRRASSWRTKSSGAD